MKQKPFVSIIVPIYRAENTIKECIQSLLNLNYPTNRYELLLVFNEQKDKYDCLIPKDKHIRRLYELKKGPAAARNKGLKNAKGKYIFFTDSDCVVSDDWINVLLAKFIRQVGCVGGQIKAYEVTNSVQKKLQDSLNQKHGFYDFPKPAFVTANVAFLKEAILKVRGFDENFIVGEDFDLCWRLQDKTKYVLAFSEKATVRHKFSKSYMDYYRKMKGYYLSQVSAVKSSPAVKRNINKRPLLYDFLDWITFPRRIMKEGLAETYLDFLNLTAKIGVRLFA